MSVERGGKCWNCAADLTALDYGRADTCPKCGKATKACRNCEFYDRNLNNECRETQADRVVEKEKSNFCDYFRPLGSSQGGAASRDAMKAAAEALFRKK